jgi:Molecular chaperone
MAIRTYSDDPILGIDLGTTNSCAAIIDEAGKVQLIPYKDGSFTIPSVYAVNDRGIELIGQEAKRQWQLNPRNTIYAAKRLIGRSSTDEVVTAMKDTVAYRMMADDNGDDDVIIECADRYCRPADVSAQILNKIRTVASDYLQKPIHRAVVTVPAYFNDRQRQTVKDAGLQIDLDIVRIINEPTSAALAYGLNKSFNGNVLVYDMGGGTFDVSVIEVREGNVFEVKATGGDIFLGGLDFDNALIRSVLCDFVEKHAIDLAEDPVAMQRIRDMAERVKIDLSSRDSAMFNIPFVALDASGMPLNIELNLTRDWLNELVSPLIDHSLEIVERVLTDSGLRPNEIDEVLLIGGQTRMPLIQERIVKMFGRQPSKGINPDEAVAIGAALYGQTLESDSPVKLQLLDVIPMGIGIERADGRMQVIFPRNSATPNAKAMTATTSRNNQETLCMRIYQGESPTAQENELLGEFLFSGISPAPAGKAQVELTFHINIEGILSMSALDLSSGKRMETSVKIKGS